MHPADLEPSLVGDRTYVTRRRYVVVDAAVVLSGMLVLLYLIPARLILPGLTDIGRPALLVGLVMWFWWLLVRLNPALVMVGPQPMRWAVLCYMIALLISYAAGFLRGLTLTEANGADRAMLMAAVFTGVILMAADGIPNWARFRSLLYVYVYSAGMMAVIGLLQFALQLDLTQYIQIPGLQEKGWVPTFETRGAGIRVASTAFHYIEFSTAMAVALPFAIHLVRFSTGLRRRVFLVLALLIAAAIPATISRTGLVALAIAILAMLPVWSWRMRYNMLGLAVCLVACFMVVKPGLVGTIKNLFTSAEEDTSVSARTERYGMVYDYFVQRPWLGRGTGTWLPPQYQILDNQWLTTALANGVVGVAALAGLHLTGIVLAIIALRRSTTAEDRHICAVLIAAQLIAIVVAGTFDSLSFSTYAITVAMLTGCCGTVWRFTHPAGRVRTSTPGWFAD